MKRRPGRLALWVTLGITVGLSLVGWIVVTGPTFGGEATTVPSGVSASAERLEADVRTLVERHAPRDYEHPEVLDGAARWIGDSMTAAGLTVTEQPYDVAGVTYRNVIARMGPETGPRIVIGAHYDTAGPLPGADDNGSGIAALLELARLLAPSPPALTVELVAYTLEEPPFFRTGDMGSAVHARSLADAGVEVRGMLSLETMGYYSDEPGSQAFPFFVLRAFYPGKGNFIAVVGKLGQGGLIRRVKKAMRATTTLPVYSISAPAFIPGIDFSDHLSYWAHGYPAAMVTDTAFFRNERYHTADDTPDTLDYARLALAVDGVHGAVRALAAE